MIWLIVLLVVIVIVVVLVIILARPPTPSGPSVPLTPIVPPGPPVIPMPCLTTSMNPGQWYFIKNRRIVNNRTYYLNYTQDPVNGRYNTILSTDGFTLPGGRPNPRFAWFLTTTGILANRTSESSGNQTIAQRIFATIPYMNVGSDDVTPTDDYYWSTQNGAITSVDKQWAVVPIGISSYYIAGLQTYNSQNTQQCGWEYEAINI